MLHPEEERRKEERRGEKGRAEIIAHGFKGGGV